MLCNIGDILICTKEVNMQCLEMSNPDFNIKVGDIYIVTDKDDYPEENDCHWYELTSKDKKLVLNAWNDAPDHMIVDECFKRMEDKQNKKIRYIEQ